MLIVFINNLKEIQPSPELRLLANSLVNFKSNNPELMNTIGDIFVILEAAYGECTSTAQNEEQIRVVCSYCTRFVREKNNCS